MWDPGRNSPHFQCSRKPTLCVKPPAREKDKPALVNRAGKLLVSPEFSLGKKHTGQGTRVTLTSLTARRVTLASGCPHTPQ